MAGPQTLAGPVLTNGLRDEFNDTYQATRNLQASGMLGQVMDLSIQADNAQHEFGYFNAAPHMARWDRGSSVPTDAMDSVQWTVPVYTFARRIPWHKDDRKDDRTQSLYDMASQAGTSAALNRERLFFSVLQNDATDLLPAIPLAPDGAPLYSATANGSARFAATGGNIVSGNGVGTSANVRADFYTALERFFAFQDGKGQPLLSPEVVNGGFIIIHGSENTEVMEETFLQRRQGLVYGSNSAAATPSNLVLDASRNVELWGTPRITGNDFYVFLKNTPKLPTFYMEREALKTMEATEDGQNSDFVRDTGMEYLQFEERSGAGAALPFGTIKVDN